MSSTFTIKAKRAGKCRACGEPIEEGDYISKIAGEAGPFVHSACCGEYYGEEALWD